MCISDETEAMRGASHFHYWLSRLSGVPSDIYLPITTRIEELAVLLNWPLKEDPTTGLKYIE